MALRMPVSALLLLALASLAVLPPARAEDAPKPTTPEATALALGNLTSPFERTRRAAVRELVEGLPATRDAVIAAVEGAPPEVQLLLVEVLAADASLPSIRTLLATMNAAGEPLAVRIRLQLARGEATARKVLEAWAEDPKLREDASGEVTVRTRLLEQLLRRAETERLFVSRKSRTGSTGSYRGQYDVLRPYRKEALELCVGVLTDRAIPIPGVYTAGTFTFLRPPPVHVRTNELIGMAAHAFSELAEDRDTGHVMVLSRRLIDLWLELQGVSYWDNVRFDDLLHQYADLLVALYLVRPETFRERLEDFLGRLGGDRAWRNTLGRSYGPIVLLRVGRYEEAVRDLEMLLDFEELITSKASAHYNLACAYAQWGESLEGRERAAKLERALDHLELSVDHKWLDIGWMEQDRDLEPIRDTARYRRLAARVHAALYPEDD